METFGKTYLQTLDVRKVAEVTDAVIDEYKLKFKGRPVVAVQGNGSNSVAVCLESHGGVSGQVGEFSVLLGDGIHLKSPMSSEWVHCGREWEGLVSVILEVLVSLGLKEGRGNGLKDFFRKFLAF